MIIAVPLDETKEKVCVSFGRAPYFMMHDTKTDKTDIINNPAAEAQGGAGIKSAQLVVDNNADALITVRCGENAAQVFSAAKVEIYEASGLDAKQNVNSLMEGKLKLLTHFHAGFHGKQ